MAKTSVRTKVGNGGRIVLPAEFRRALGLHPGDPAVLVLDASAVLALSNQEPGAEQVEQAIDDGSAISAVNLSEAVAKLSTSRTDTMVRELLEEPQLQVMPFDAEAAYQAGFLPDATKHLSLSLGDRACLALARQLGVPALTTDRAWQNVHLGITIRLIC